ncbi:MAG: hypothetical protein HOQ19_08910 [Gemmatimonadaceae bacterium]|nr:hypothetical protein [Gemmatimonadaceae bacterium]NUP55939.1 hypothetical protein [Gemmatimonadaceae bacterium]
MRSERIVGLTLLSLLCSACEIEKVSIPRTDSRVALHAVLSATAPSQVMLLERTRTGSVAVVGSPFDAPDPIFTDAGITESNAFVRLVTPDGRTLIGLEDSAVRSDGKGFGVYRFDLPGSALVRGGTYKLLVQTLAGENLSAETSVPGGAAADVAVSLTFDRSRDTALVEWPAAAGARSYFVRVETPFGPRAFFTDSTRVRLPGDLRNVDTDALRHVFIPGFPQAVTVSAVDSNYYDWYRSHNDAISGAGLVNRVQGGLGVFGSLVRLRYEQLTVVAPQSGPAAGTFVPVGSAQELSVSPYLQLQLYVESPAARSDQADALSGRSQRRVGFGDPGCAVCGILGTTRNGRIELALLRGWSATDTMEVFTGEIRGDTIVGSYRGLGGVAHFVKQQ